MSEMMRVLIPIIVTHAVVLAVLLFTIKRLLSGDTSRAVEQVKQVESEIRKKESRIRQDIEEHEKDFQRRKDEAERELQRHKEEADKEVARARDQVLGEARKEADRVIDQARRNEEKLRQQIAQDMEERAVAYSSDVVKMVYTEGMLEAVDRVFTNELLDALEEVDAANITVSGDNVEFVTARPMAGEQRDRLQNLLRDKFGLEIRVEEKIDEELLAGLAFKLGSLEIDGSLRSRMQEAVEEVRKGARPA